MTQLERKKRLEELRQELQDPMRMRSRDVIIMEGRALRFAFDLYNAKHPTEQVKLI